MTVFAPRTGHFVAEGQARRVNCRIALRRFGAGRCRQWPGPTLCRRSVKR